jgi:hypothetical protein
LEAEADRLCNAQRYERGRRFFGRLTVRISGEGDLFRARLDRIINLQHELVQLAGKIDWDWLDREVAPLYSDKGRPERASRPW